MCYKNWHCPAVLQDLNTLDTRKCKVKLASIRLQSLACFVKILLSTKRWAQTLPICINVWLENINHHGALLFSLPQEAATLPVLIITQWRAFTCSQCVITVGFSLDVFLFGSFPVLSLRSAKALPQGWERGNDWIQTDPQVIQTY